MSFQTEIILIAALTAFSCAIPGVFLVLRGVALMSDAISHAILLGIVVMFFMVKTLDSPLLIIGAALTGVLTVTLTEVLINTNRLKKDAAIGLVFPLFFSIGVILISKYAGNVHIDLDAVLLGELALAPFHRMDIGGLDLGPVGLWMMGTISLINVVGLLLFYKELKLATFDKGLATSLGFSPVLIHYGLMTVTSVTTVGAFEVAGSVLVVALIIAPPATAFLLTTKLSRMIGISMAVGVASAVLGYGMAYVLDASIAGSMATMNGVLFLMALFFARERGLVSKVLSHFKKKLNFSVQMLLVQILGHEGLDNEDQENTVENMIDHMAWSAGFAKKIVQRAVQKNLITRNKSRLSLTPLGREMARQVMMF
ncbi:metal ABC transporter permease [bacterium]|jgi:manganese/zinc/iron transport system permease protein|nr:metal ABC transporter permease [bacterium]